MKIAVINFSGNVGKSTVVRHLLAPRMPHAEVRAIESINSDEANAAQQKHLRGNEFGKLYAWLLSVDHAVVDVGASNVEEFISLMSDYEGSHEAFEIYIVPTVPDAKQQKDTRATIDALEQFGVEPERIRLLFNMADKKTPLAEAYAALFEYHRREKTFALSEQAVLFESPAYQAAASAGVTIGELAAKRDVYKESLGNSEDATERSQWAQLVAFAAIATGVNAQLDRAYSALVG